MCPIFRATHTEAATPPRPNLIRHLLSEGGDAQGLSSDDVREVADLSFNCKM